METTKELLDRIENLERRLALTEDGSYKPATFEFEREVPLVQDLKIASASNGSSTSVVLNWIEPQDSQIEGYDIYSKNITDQASSWTKIGEVVQPPFGLNILADSNKTINFGVRTKYRNGLGTSIDNMVTAPLAVTEPVDTITTASQIANGIVGNSKLDRTTDAISITNADILSLAATKITAGTLAAGVIYANAIAASQISAGTISVALVLTSPDIQSTSGSSFARLNGGSILSYGTLGYVTTSNGVVTVATHSSGSPTALSTVISPSSIILQDASANIAATLQDVGSGNGRLILSSGGSASITLTGSTGSLNLTGAYQMDGSDIINSSRSFVGTSVDVSGDVDFGDELRQNGTLIVNNAGAFVGAGVDVGSNGVGCGGVNVNGDTGETVTFNAFPTQMVFKGGVLTGYTP